MFSGAQQHGALWSPALRVLGCPLHTLPGPFHCCKNNHRGCASSCGIPAPLATRPTGGWGSCGLWLACQPGVGREAAAGLLLDRASSPVLIGWRGFPNGACQRRCYHCRVNSRKGGCQHLRP